MKKSDAKSPVFSLGQEVHLVRNHCDNCCHLEGEMAHPIRILAELPYSDCYTYRIEDARGAHYQTRESCLCTDPKGHRSTPCVFCGQVVA